MLVVLLSAIIPFAIGATYLNFSFPDNGTFGTFSEGAGLDVAGNVYAVNYFTRGSNASLASRIIGKVNAVGGSVVEGIILPSGQNHLYNGVDFDLSGNAYVADSKGNKVYKAIKKFVSGHNIFSNATVVCDLKAAVGKTGISTPNDVVMSYDGKTAYLSGMNYNKNLGLLARCDVASGKVNVIYRGLRTNGIELAPDQTKLYFTEGGSKQEWINVMDLSNLGIESVYNFTLKELPAASDLDGMRFDVNGTLYVTMSGSGKVAIVDVKGKKVTSFVDLPLMSNPTNLAIDGQTVIVVGHNKGVVNGVYTFASQAPGARFTNLRKTGTQALVTNHSSVSRSATLAVHWTTFFLAMMFSFSAHK